MRSLKAFLTLAAVSALALAACSRGSHDQKYAPASQQEPEPPATSDAQSTPQPQARAVEGGLPNAPIPYDQLDSSAQGAQPGAKAPPKPKSNDKAVFY